MALTLLQPLIDALVANTGRSAAEAWPKGPASQYRFQEVTVAQYLDWLRKLEAALPGQTAKKIVQRLRRLYFSTFTEKVKPGASGLADNKVITDITGYADPPLTTDTIAADVLDGLYGTGSIITASGKRVDVGHIWIVIDLALAGSKIGPLEAFWLDSEMESLLSWGGDLGSALNKYTKAMNRLPQNARTDARRKEALRDAVKGLASKADIFGDMDGVILARHWKGKSSFIMSDAFEEYYADDDETQAQAKLLPHPNSARRFHYFLRDAKPQISASGTDSSPLDVTLQRAAAVADLKEEIILAADDLLAPTIGGGTYSAEDNLSKAGEAAFDDFLQKFADFLESGLATGDGTWPPP